MFQIHKGYIGGLIAQCMSIRSIHVKVIASAIDDIELISNAVSNLLHKEAELEIKGANHTTVQCKLPSKDRLREEET